MFDEKVALMEQEEELPESRTAEQGTLIALTTGQMVTLFTTGPDGRAKLAPVKVVLDDAKGAAGEKVGFAFSTSINLDAELTRRPSSIIRPLVSLYTPRGTRTTTSVRSSPTGRRSGTRRAKTGHCLYRALSVIQSGGDHGVSGSRIPKSFPFYHELCRRRLRWLPRLRERILSSKVQRKHWLKVMRMGRMRRMGRAARMRVIGWRVSPPTVGLVG